MKKERWIAHNQDGMPKRLHPNTLVNIWFEWATAEFPPALNTPACGWGWGNGTGIIGYQTVQEVAE